MTRSSMKRQSLAAVLALVMACNLMVCPMVLASEEAILKNMIITNTRDDLIAYFDVEGAFTEKITQAVLSGIPTTFSFFVSIYKIRDPGFDKKIVALEFSSTLKYNRLKEEFSVSRPWKTEKPFVTKSFEQAKTMMVEIDNLKVVPLKRLTKGEVYQIRIKAELRRVTLPLYLHYVLFFLSLWDFETDWHTIDFVY
ncbi:MAG: DUF4390 domain-containing protein [Pseudomonadota bacterium]